MHICMYIGRHVYMYIQTTYIHAYIHVFVYICIHAHEYFISMCLFTYIHTCPCISAYTHVFKYAYIHIYVCMYVMYILPIEFYTQISNLSVSFIFLYVSLSLFFSPCVSISIYLPDVCYSNEITLHYGNIIT